MVGFLAPAANTALLARMGRTVPQHLMGRVVSNMEFSGQVLAITAPIVAGTLLTHVGPHTALAAFAVAEAAAAKIAVTQRHAWGTPAPSPTEADRNRDRISSVDP
jgi:hypothetical protein